MIVLKSTTSEATGALILIGEGDAAQAGGFMRGVTTSNKLLGRRMSKVSTYWNRWMRLGKGDSSLSRAAKGRLTSDGPLIGCQWFLFINASLFG